MSDFRWGAPAEFPAVYEALNVTGFFTEFSEDLLDRVAPRDGERFLDVATGTGIVPRRARERCPGLERLTGLDLTPGMLAVAREKGEGIEFVEGDATDMPFEDGAFDILTCQQGVQFFPDRARGLSEFRRVLAPGGRVFVSVWCDMDRSPGHQILAQTVGERFPEFEGPAGAPFAFGDGDALGELVDAAGFKDVELQRVDGTARFETGEDFARAFMEGSPMALSMAEVPAAERDALLGEIAGRIKERFGEPVAAPMATHIATGRV